MSKTEVKQLTQKEKVLKHLEKYGKINSGYAISQLGITRLAAVIWLLKDDGYDIETIKPKKKGFATYVLRGE